MSKYANHSQLLKYIFEMIANRYKTLPKLAILFLCEDSLSEFHQMFLSYWSTDTARDNVLKE